MAFICAFIAKSGGDFLKTPYSCILNPALKKLSLNVVKYMRFALCIVPKRHLAAYALKAYRVKLYIAREMIKGFANLASAI